MIEKFKSLGKDTLVYGTGNFIMRVIGVFLVPIYTRIFSPSDYGIMDVLSTVSSMLTIFIIMGFTTAQSFFFFDTDDKQERCLMLSTSLIYRSVISVGVCIALLASAQPFSKYILGSEEYAVYLRLLALATPFQGANTLFFNIQRMTFAKWRFLFLTVGSGLFGTLLSIYLVIIKKVGLIGVFQAQLYGAMFFTLCGLVLSKDYLRFSFSFSRLKELLKYGIPLIPAGLSIWVIQFADRYFLVHYASMMELGLYAIGNKVASLVVFVTMAFRMAWAPFGFSVAKQEDAQQFYAKVLTYYLVGLSLLCVLCSLFAREILMVFTQPAYYGGSRVVGLLAFSGVGYGVLQIVGMGLVLTKKTHFSGLAFGVAALANVVLNFILVPRFGIMGASLATVICFCIANAILYRAGQRYYNIPFELTKIFKLLVLSATVMIIGLLLDKNYNSIVFIVKAFLPVLLIVSLFIVSVVTREEIVSLSKVIIGKLK
jgi:O-antigen/teichoic acid export membrane protein